MKFYISKVKTAHTAELQLAQGTGGILEQLPLENVGIPGLEVKELVSEAWVSSECFGISRTEGKSPNSGRVTDN